MNNNDELIEDILQFWFADIGDGFDAAQQNKLWFLGGIDADDRIRERFGPIAEQALAGGLSRWKGLPEGIMALIILLDQFPRNIFRGQAKAFSGDSQAKQLVHWGLKEGMDKRLTYMQRSFFYMPLEHSEDLEDQILSVQLFEQLLEEVPAKGKATIEGSLRYAEQHRDIIQQFGRFPHRNALLQRDPTRQELEYLAGGGARFGQ